MPSLIAMMNEAVSATMANTIDITVAVGTGTCPEAIGRFLFFGCSRSDSISWMSLRRYTALERKQNARNATSAFAIFVGSLNSTAKINPANTMLFLTHCVGRHARMYGLKDFIFAIIIAVAKIVKGFWNALPVNGIIP